MYSEFHISTKNASEAVRSLIFISSRIVRLAVRVLQRIRKGMESGLKESDGLAGSNQTESVAETGGNQSDASGSIEGKSQGETI